jgi:hypothetical protein
MRYRGKYVTKHEVCRYRVDAMWLLAFGFRWRPTPRACFDCSRIKSSSLSGDKPIGTSYCQRHSNLSHFICPPSAFHGRQQGALCRVSEFERNGLDDRPVSRLGRSASDSGIRRLIHINADRLIKISSHRDSAIVIITYVLLKDQGGSTMRVDVTFSR